MRANKLDGDCFALVRAHQHGITIHNQNVMRERESGVILFIAYYYGVGEGWSWEIVKFLLSIRLGWGGGRTMLGGGTIVLPLPFCIKPDKLMPWTIYRLPLSE